MFFVTVHRWPHPYWYPGSEHTSAISLGKFKTNKLGDKCPGSQMTALWEVWKHFAKPTPAPPCPPSHWSTPCHGSGKVGQMLRVKKAPVGEWEWCFGSEGETIKRREHGGAEVRGGSLFTTPDLLWNTFSLIGENRIGAQRSSALKVGEDKRVQANSNMILRLTENSGEMREFTGLTFLKVCSQTNRYVTRGTDTQTRPLTIFLTQRWFHQLTVKIGPASVFRKEGKTKVPRKN